MPTPTETFLDRLPAGAPPAVRETIEIAGRFVDTFRQKAATIRKDPTLSPQGQHDKIRGLLSGGLGDHFKQVRGKVDHAIAEIASEIGGLKKRAVELLSDGYSPELRREARDRLQMLSPNDRRRLALESDDRLIQAAILEASAFLTGLDPQVHTAVEQRLVESMFAERLSQLEPVHRAWEAAAAALTVARNAMAREAELDAAEFEQKLAA